ncbi:MAG: DUF3558 family protein [Rhodococcus sp.]|nr:DUF3558 family protein [Rhodococcus sp. (in: high G+C Gram-positive bacteria)]
MKRQAIVSAAAACAAALTACGGTGGPAPGPTTTEAVAITFHPCDDLPIDVIEGLGFIPGGWTRTDREHPWVSHECATANNNRESPGYSTVFSARGMSFQSVLDDSRLTEYKRTTVDGRDVYFADHSGLECLVTVDVDPAVFQFTVNYAKNTTQPDRNFTTIEQACTEAERILDVILPYVPEQLSNVKQSTSFSASPH